MKLTYHLVPREYYEAQPLDQPYVPEPMQAGREAFIHCTDGNENLIATANRHYQNDAREFVVLLVDLEQTSSPFRYEDPAKIYPHIYGSLHRRAILSLHTVQRDPTGLFIAIS